ncbi:MAG: peptidyl-prolyl cis-trans isomerase SurA, partial [Flavobacteriales bacterium]
MNSLNRLFTLLFILVLSASSFAQNESDIVLTVGDENVTKTDFESIFRKNNRDSVVTAAALDEYMELFINFKLKVKEAREEGLDTNASFIRELQGYRTQLARPYLIDNELLDELIQEAYKRTGEEVRASHILIKCDANAQPEDTVRAYNRINELRKRIIGGEIFTTVAKSKGGSEDPSVRDNNGDLGYFTAFQMVYPFETAAFKSATGEISPIIRTRYGFHILNITDKRAARGEVKVSHIMIRNKDTKDPVEMKETETKAREI